MWCCSEIPVSCREFWHLFYMSCMCFIKSTYYSFCDLRYFKVPRVYSSEIITLKKECWMISMKLTTLMHNIKILVLHSKASQLNILFHWSITHWTEFTMQLTNKLVQITNLGWVCQNHPNPFFAREMLKGHSNKSNSVWRRSKRF